MITILDNFFHFIIKLVSSIKSLHNFNNIKVIKWNNNENKINTYSTEQSPSWEANRFSVSQEIPRFL